jgi:hypothetical protein
MCLWIKSDQKENDKDLKKWFGSRKKFAYVYKVLIKSIDEDLYRSAVYSFIWDFNNQKIFQVDRDPKPTGLELHFGDIHKGFHVYTSLEAARPCTNPNYKIIKFKVLKKDIVAVNTCSCEAVCTRLEFVKVLED